MVFLNIEVDMAPATSFIVNHPVVTYETPCHRTTLHAPVAQRIEHLTTDQEVARSNRAWGTEVLGMAPERELSNGRKSRLLVDGSQAHIH